MATKTYSVFQSLSKLNTILLLDKKDIGAIYIFAIMAGLIQLSLPLGIQSIIGFLTAGAFSTSIIVLIAMVIFGVFLNGLLQVRQLQIMEKVQQKLFLRFSMEFGDRLPKLNIEKLDKTYPPELVNRYFEIMILQKGLDNLVIDLPAALIQIILGLTLLSFYHPLFIGFGLFLLMIVFIILRFTANPGLRTAMHASDYKYDIASWLQEIARTIKTFKYTRHTSIHTQRTDELVGKYLNFRTAHFKILITQFWSLISFKIFLTAVMLTVGSYLLVKQQINIGQFIAADIVIIMIIASIEKLVTNLDTIFEAMVSVEKLAVITEAEIETSGSLHFPDKNLGAEVTFKNVVFAYDDEMPVLNGISFHLNPGQFVQLAGKSGAGKSTVLRLLTGAFTNFDGSILLDNLPLQNYDLQDIRMQTGILLSHQDIFYGSILDNITMGNEATDMEEINFLTKLTGLNTYIEQTKNGYDTLLLPVGNKLSFEVKKNILLIRAMLGNQRILLLEEPFDHLPEPNRSNVIMHIKNKYTTLLFTSRDESMVQYCDQVIRITQNGENI